MSLYRTGLIGFLVMTGAPFVFAALATFGLTVFMAQEGVMLPKFGQYVLFFVSLGVTFKLLRDAPL